jgi:hypothetical protein
MFMKMDHKLVYKICINYYLHVNNYISGSGNNLGLYLTELM